MNEFQDEISVVLVVVPNAEDLSIVGDRVVLAALQASPLRLAEVELSRLFTESFGVRLARARGDELTKSRSYKVLKVLQRASSFLLAEADALALSWKAQNARNWSEQLASLRTSAPNRTTVVGSVPEADTQSRASVKETDAGLIRVGERLNASPQLSASLIAAQIRSDAAVGDAIRAIEDMQLI
jgi:hypothetical protein